jgi:hypothetical protein
LERGPSSTVLERKLQQYSIGKEAPAVQYWKGKLQQYSIGKGAPVAQYWYRVL